MSRAFGRENPASLLVERDPHRLERLHAIGGHRVEIGDSRQRGSDGVCDVRVLTAQTCAP